MLNNITTLGTPVINTSQIIRIESKQKKSQCVPYFFTTNNVKKVTSNNEKKILQNKKNIIKK